MMKRQDLAMTHRSWKRWLVQGLGAAAALAVVASIVVSLMIASGVREARDMALREHRGDPVTALIAYVDTPRHSLGERNRAVWALGQLGDPRPLPVLEKHFTGGPCQHERALCQRELSKAIELCRGGTNVTALVWRHGSLRP